MTDYVVTYAGAETGRIVRRYITAADDIVTVARKAEIGCPREWVVAAIERDGMPYAANARHSLRVAEHEDAWGRAR